MTIRKLTPTCVAQSTLVVFSFIMNVRIPITKKERDFVYKKFDGVCTYCLKVIPRLGASVDHIKAVANGGENTKKNYTLACRPCNSLKLSYFSLDEARLYVEGRLMKKIAEIVRVNKNGYVGFKELHHIFKYQNFYKDNWPVKWPFDKARRLEISRLANKAKSSRRQPPK